MSAFEGRAALTSSCHYTNGQDIFVQGDRADAVFRVEDGNVKLTVRATGGKRAVIAVLRAGECFGEGCLEGTPVRGSTATAMRGCNVSRVTKVHLLARLRSEPALARLFITYLLQRVARSEDDHADRLLHSSERRLARLLLWIAHPNGGTLSTSVDSLDQGTLAQMVGTTRSRVSFFMNRFRKQGFIDYNGRLHVHKALLTFLRGPLHVSCGGTTKPLYQAR
ncbi:MAG: Crp/Fnr family transcriptional regulator [Acidobacteriota bacterium]|nr:Crp/Fnr family transcriptional regulator [Acidobacteriota bacterium]